MDSNHGGCNRRRPYGHLVTHELVNLSADYSLFLGRCCAGSLADCEAPMTKQCAECLESARLLGMSGSREAKLLAEIDALKRAINNHNADLNAAEPRVKCSACGREWPEDKSANAWVCHCGQVHK